MVKLIQQDKLKIGMDTTILNKHIESVKNGVEYLHPGKINV